MEDKRILTLFELNSLVRQALKMTLKDEYWIQAELSEVHPNPNGHCYLEFIQKDAKYNSMYAKAKGVIWKDDWQLIKSYFEETTGQAFVSGINVQVQVSVAFHEVYGYTLVVHNINPEFTLGDMALKRRAILKQIEEDGILTMNKELEMPLLTQRVAVISSPAAAGYGDFCRQLIDNRMGLAFYIHLFPAIMQGNQIENSILTALDNINEHRDLFDIVVIIRGGGATSDLSGFDTYPLAAACAQFPLPIITGIGHERDDTVIDMIAHTRVKTPTAAAQILIDNQAEQLSWVGQAENVIKDNIGMKIQYETERLSSLAQSALRGIPGRLEKEHLRLNMMRQSVQSKIGLILMNELHNLDSYSNRMKYGTKQKLVSEQSQLSLIQQHLADNSPQRLLSKGYTITYMDGHVLKDIKTIKPGSELQTIMAGGKVYSKVIKTKEDE